MTDLQSGEELKVTNAKSSGKEEKGDGSAAVAVVDEMILPAQLHYALSVSPLFALPPIKKKNKTSPWLVDRMVVHAVAMDCGVGSGGWLPPFL
jgi:hypothetical protein